MVNFEKGDMDRVFACYAQTLEAGEKLGDPKLVARASNNMGATYNVLGDREKAIRFYGRSLENYRLLGDDFGVAQTYHNIGMTYAELRNWGEAAQFYQKSLELSHKIQEASLISISSLALGEAHGRVGKTGEALDLADRALTMFFARDDKLGVADAHRVMGFLKVDLGDPEAAEDHFRKALQIARECESLLQVAETCRDCGAALARWGRVSEAREKLLEAMETFLGVGAKENAADVEKILREVDQAPAHALESAPEPQRGSGNRSAAREAQSDGIETTAT